jgi:hypothetical protein
MGATILWDALVASCIMLQAQIRGFGVYTNCEVFNDILEHHFSDTENISDEGKLQMVRAVGCVAARPSTLTVRSAFARAAIKSLTHATLCFCRVAIVKNGSMYPTMELLLRHSIQYLHLRGKTAVSAPGILDNEGLLLKGMSMDGGLTDEERRVAMSIYVLACILDGDMGEGQMQLWAHMVSCHLWPFTQISFASSIVVIFASASPAANILMNVSCLCVRSVKRLVTSLCLTRSVSCG